VGFFAWLATLLAGQFRACGGLSRSFLPDLRILKFFSSKEWGVARPRLPNNSAVGLKRAGNESRLQQKSPPREGRIEGAKPLLLACLWLSLLAAPARGEDSAQRIEFDIPRMRAADALMKFADQSSTPLLVSFDLVDSVEANEIHGSFSLDEAVSALLQGTGLEGKLNSGGVLVVSKALEQERGQKVRSVKSKSLLASVSSIVIGALVANSSTVAVAQEGGRLDEITVTAQKREQGANDVGITLNAFTGDQLEARGVLAAEDLALYTPGLTVNETGATGVPLYTIRGVGFQDYSTGASSTVGLYFDEVAIPYTVMSRGILFDVERVEVLKGPQGDLYGRNTTAGQINFVSKKPTNELEAGASIGYSSFETVNADMHLSGPIAEGVTGRIAFTTTQSGKGWQESLTRPDDRLGKKDVFGIRGMLNFELGSVGDLLLRAQYVKDKSDNKANTTYDGRLVGLGEFNSPYGPLFPYVGTGDAPLA